MYVRNTALLGAYIYPFDPKCNHGPVTELPTLSHVHETVRTLKYPFQAFGHCKEISESLIREYVRELFCKNVLLCLYNDLTGLYAQIRQQLFYS